MKSTGTFFIFLFISLSSCFAQQVGVFSGIHAMEYKSGKPLADESKLSIGFEVKEIYNHFGLYCNFYSSKIKTYGDTIVVRELQEPWARRDIFDSAVYELNIMPRGTTVGINYIFPFRLSVYAGAGLATYSVQRMQYNNIYHPSATGWYDYLRSSQYAESIREVKRKAMFEVGVDYDLIPSPLWAFGVRVGYNSVMKISGQVMVGFNFGRFSQKSEPQTVY